MNYNDLQRMKPYYNTMNFRYNDNIPKALPILRNSRFDHANVTVAPPIPSYYKQNINSSNYYSHLPNIMNVTYSSAEKIAKNFSNNLNNLRNLEQQIAEGNRVYNLPKLNQTQNDINYQNMLKAKAREKLENGATNENGNDEDLKEKMNQMRQEAGRIPDYKTEEQKRIMQNKEIMSEENINAFNKNLISTLGDYSNSIQKTILTKNKNDDAMYEMIKQGITSLRDDFTKRIERFNNQSKTNMEAMRKIMQSSTNPRLKLLSENLFSTSDIDQMLKLREKNRKKNGNLIDNRRMSELMLKAQEETKLENEKKKQNEFNPEENKETDENKNIVIKKDEEVEKIPLDLWEKKRAIAVKADLAVEKKVNIFSKNYFELQPLNRFRSYVFSVMAARRILNIKYMVFKEFKFTSVSYYISNYEDMDIILKKLVYNTVKEPLLEILNNTDMNINLTYDTEDNHETYFLLQDYIQRILNNFNTRFFLGISGEMMNYLSLYITNYSFIPKDFFTTFELVRMRTSETGDFVELTNENRKMILTFYIFIKILLRNIFLELMFNQADRKKLSLNPKLNIKMLVSVLYRSIIKFLVKHCVTKTNLEDLENAEDMTAFLKVKYSKREFHLHRFLKKRYFLKVSQVEEQPRRVSRRTRKIISPKNSEDDPEERKVRETKKNMNLKNKKKLEKIEEENRTSSKDKKSSEKKSESKKSKSKKSESKKSSDKKSSDKKSSNKKSSEKKSSEKKSESKKSKDKKSGSEEDEEEEEESDSEDEKESKDKKGKKSGSKKSSEKTQSKEKKDSKKDKDEEDEEDEESDESDDSSSESESGTDKKKKKGRAPPPDSSDEEDEDDEEDDEDEEDEEDSEEESKKDKKAKKGKKEISKKSSSDKTKSSKTKSSKTKSDKTSSKKKSSSKTDKSKKTKKTKINKKSKKFSSKSKSNEEEEEEEDDEEEEEEEDDEISNDNYKEEREKLMPKRKVSTEKINGKVKQRLMGEEPKLKIAIRGKDPLKGKDTIKDFSKSDIDNMYFIIENYQSYGDDLDSNEVDLLDRVLYTNKSLDKYYLYANEYAFDPGELIDKIMDKLLEKIQINFSRLDD